MCDEDLLVRVASGDERAFETLYGRHAAAVRAFVRVRVPDAGTAVSGLGPSSRGAGASSNAVTFGRTRRTRM